MSEQGMRDPWDDGDWSGPVMLVGGDWLDLPPEALADLLALIAETPHLTWCLFSERPAQWQSRLVEAGMAGSFADHMPIDGLALASNWLREDTPPNVYVGTTVTTQAEADERIPELLAIPARVRVLRVSPREPVDLWSARFERAPGRRTSAFEWGLGIGWVVCEGGDTPMHPEWVRSLRDQCEEAGVPFWFSGWGEWAPVREDWQHYSANRAGQIVWSTVVSSTDKADLGKRSRWAVGNEKDHPGEAWELARVGKDKAGRLLDGRTWDGVPS